MKVMIEFKYPWGTKAQTTTDNIKEINMKKDVMKTVYKDGALIEEESNYLYVENIRIIDE